MRSLTALLVLSLALAGCSEDPAPAPIDDGFENVDPGADKGAISGVVVDQAIVPVADATVTLSSGQQTLTGPEGTFVFEALDPATYFVQVEANRFLATQTSIDVVAGEVAKPRIQLLPDPAPEPYHATQQLSGHMVVYGTIASFAAHLVLQEVGQSICDCEWAMNIDSVPEEILIEGFWKDSIQDPQGPQEYYLEVFDSGIDDCLWSTDVAAGFRVSLKEQCTWEQDEYRVALTGPQFWVALEQQYDLFVTPFYGAPAPEEWAFLNGSE